MSLGGGQQEKLGTRPQLGEDREDPDPSAPRGALPKRRWVVGAAVGSGSLGGPRRPREAPPPPARASGPCSRKGGRQVRAGSGAVGDAPRRLSGYPSPPGGAEEAQVMGAVPRPRLVMEMVTTVQRFGGSQQGPGIAPLNLKALLLSGGPKPPLWPFPAQGWQEAACGPALHCRPGCPWA